MALGTGAIRVDAETLRTGFLAAIGGEFGVLSADRGELTVPVTPALFQPYGIVHGGVYCTIIETLASVAGAMWFGDRGQVVGVANNTSFLRATSAGTLHAVATPIHRGRTQQLWLVEITDGDGRAIARGEVRLANLAAEQPVS